MHVYILLITVALFSCKKRVETYSINLKKVESNTKNADSLKSINLLLLTKKAYKIKNWIDFDKYRLQQLNNPQLNKFKKTTAILCDYSGYYFKKRDIQDSAYFYYNRALKIYKNSKDSIKIATMLLNIAIIEKNTFNFKVSENTSFKALKFLENKNKKRIVSSLYNNLGIVYKGLGDYSNSIKYHKKSYQLRKKLNNSSLVISSLNNISNVYKNQKEYNKAITNYKFALQFDSILKRKPATKAMLLDNYALALFLKDDLSKLPTLFFDALKIRDSINDIPGKIVSNTHLGIYYKSLHKNEVAKGYLETAKKLSKSIQYTKDEIEAMELLLDVYPPKKAIKTAKKIIFKKDSIKKQELKIKEGISRIQYETEEKEKENLQLKTQNAEQALLTQKANTQKWLFALGLLLVAITAFFLWRRYKAEAKAKKLINEQKKMVETLQKELHHRMKNNLSFIDLFINLAKTKFQDQAYQTKLNELQNRMRSMFEVHKQLFRKDDVTTVNAKKYIDVLVENVQKSYSKNNISIFNTTESKENLLANISFPFGLIINEFVTNSYKYAFDDNELGKISISLTSDHSNYHLSLADNGKGLPTDFNIDDLDSFGMETIQLLTKEYKGTFLLENSKGLKMKITLPKTAILL